MDCGEIVHETPAYAYKLLLKAALAIPTWHYVFAITLYCMIFLYNFLEFHFFEDLLTGFRGSPISLTYNSCSDIYHQVVSRCQTLHGRYLATPWLSSPHFQTTFINFFGRPPEFSYRRQLFHASDGGVFALDWLTSSDVSNGPTHTSLPIAKDDRTPIVVVIPGLTSDSASPYLKHLAYGTAKRGWNVVVSNHRGLGGISVTSDCFYNAGWTEDVRDVVNHLHDEFPVAPIFIVGTSIGANILVKYLGEDGENVPIAGAVAVCSPWDLLIGSRFICRRLVQKLYDRALTIGLQGYAQLHQPRYSRLANWEGIRKSRSIRDFDTHATCLVGNYETVDTYYRHCSSSSFVGQVSVPLLCIGSLDDPVCTREAIPWDECRSNRNIVLAMTQHGGHLAFFEGITGSSLWWVKAVNEYLGVLHASPFMHKQKKSLLQEQGIGSHSALLQSSIDQGPYLNVADGMVAAVGNDQTADNTVKDSCQNLKHNDAPKSEERDACPDDSSNTVSGTAQAPIEDANSNNAKRSDTRKSLIKLIEQNRRSVWLLAYIALLSTGPLVGAVLSFLFRKKHKKAIPAKMRN